MKRVLLVLLCFLFAGCSCSKESDADRFIKVDVDDAVTIFSDSLYETMLMSKATIVLDSKQDDVVYKVTTVYNTIEKRFNYDIYFNDNEDSEDIIDVASYVYLENDEYYIYMDDASRGYLYDTLDYYSYTEAISSISTKGLLMYSDYDFYDDFIDIINGDAEVISASRSGNIYKITASNKYKSGKYTIEFTEEYIQKISFYSNYSSYETITISNKANIDEKPAKKYNYYDKDNVLYFGYGW